MARNYELGKYKKSVESANKRKADYEEKSVKKVKKVSKEERKLNRIQQDKYHKLEKKWTNRALKSYGSVDIGKIKASVARQMAKDVSNKEWSKWGGDTILDVIKKRDEDISAEEKEFNQKRKVKKAKRKKVSEYAEGGKVESLFNFPSKEGRKR